MVNLYFLSLLSHNFPLLFFPSLFHFFFSSSVISLTSHGTVGEFLTLFSSFIFLLRLPLRSFCSFFFLLSFLSSLINQPKPTNCYYGQSIGATNSSKVIDHTLNFSYDFGSKSDWSSFREVIGGIEKLRTLRRLVLRTLQNTEYIDSLVFGASSSLKWTPTDQCT